MADVDAGLAFLVAQTAASIAVVFWYTLVLEVPRYVLGFVALVLTGANRKSVTASVSPRLAKPRISVGVIGHNEAEALERCVRSLREQSVTDLEIIIVSDGSTDGMARVAHGLVTRGLADKSFATALRGGKSAGINLAIGAATGDIFVVVDCDCSYDRFAMESIVAPFADSGVGAVAGDLVPRNAHASLVARFQAIEYLIAISVGKQIGAELGQVDCISGAFGAFRLDALRSVGGYDVGGGEDLDLTIRLRAAGWRIAFAPGAVCYTDVPESLWPLVRQRLRWERDSVRIRFRKHRRSLNALRHDFKVSEAIHQWDFLVFGVGGAVVFPAYLIWLFATYGEFAVPVIVAMQLALVILDMLSLALADMASGRRVFWSHAPYMLGYSIFTSYVMRMVRLWAYAEEWLRFASINDNYVPLKVRTIRKW
jgi:cellulose synthase/poly-beta-1,6-N-acetylglucosamine synthase-like glycosyltransferase